MSKRTCALVGERFGKWTVLAEGKYKSRLCRCDCGTVKTVDACSLAKGLSRECGCSKAGRRLKQNRDTDRPEYTTWVSIKGRCYYPCVNGYQRYGGRGIGMCDEWKRSFKSFYRDMGPKPTPQHSIDRINNEGNYEPANCRWATRKEQAANKRPRKAVVRP